MYVFKIWNHLLDTVVPTDPAKKRDFFARRMGKLTTKLLRLYIYVYLLRLYIDILVPSSTTIAAQEVGWGS
jgi:hypothetical protein